jgi:hypothetical protein
MFRKARGSFLLVNGVHVNRPTGKISAVALRRLRKDRPDLYADVIAGKLVTLPFAFLVAIVRLCPCLLTIVGIRNYAESHKREHASANSTELIGPVMAHQQASPAPANAVGADNVAIPRNWKMPTCKPLVNAPTHDKHGNR